MRMFFCPGCGTPIAFDNTACSCGTSFGFDDRISDFVKTDRHCGNAQMIGCNWIPLDGSALCRACRMTTVTPDTDTADNRLLWAESERAKRWVLYCLAQWGWFGVNDPGPSPEFHLLSEVSASGMADVMMGHLDGVITINVSEADAAVRVHRRQLLGERFRTVIGHMRHELSHFLFQRLMAEAPDFETEFRSRFGDEKQDYAAALESYYATGPDAGWADAYVTPYASSHPHEDWAESAAHIQHIVDIVDSYLAAGLSSPSLEGFGTRAYAEPSGERLVTLGVELGIALNHVNRSMGLPDIYPFVLTPSIREKLVFAHRWLRR